MNMMGDTLFLQFYNQIKGSYFDLCNGFSDTHDLCRSKGEFYWTQHEVDGSKWYDEEIYVHRKLPISRGTVYISAVYLNHLYQSYVWAREYPHIQFVVGGPVTAERSCSDDAWNPVYFQLAPHMSLPGNLKITGMSVEDWFHVPNFSGQWKLMIPENVDASSPIYFSYTLDNRCYWSKCIYCNIALHAGEHFRQRKELNFEFADVTHKGAKIVRLNTGSLTPAHIRKLLPRLPRGDDLEYRLFMRPARPENDALKDMIARIQGPLPSMTLGLGIEFPSDRMLKYAGKGFSKEEILESLAICRDHGIRANGNVMLGWNNLIKEDLDNLRDFMERVPAGSMATIQIRWLFAHPYTEIHETCSGEPIHLGPFYLGFRTEVDDVQRALNREAADIIDEFSSVKRFRADVMVHIRRYLEQD
jgi:hypothetical protein